MKRVVSLAVLAALLPSCVSGRATTVAGAATAGLGILIIANKPSQDMCVGADGEREFGCTVGTGYSDVVETLLGAALVLAGGGLMVAGLAQDDKAEATTAPVPPPAPPPVATAPAPLPAQTVIDTNRPENRLALQASLSARAGLCQAAIVTAAKLAELDVERYRKLLVADPTLAACYKM